MNTLSNLLTAIIIAAWISAIAVLSVQNFGAVSLKFLFFESIQLPLGVMLGFSVAVGTIVGVFLPLLGNSPVSRRRNRFPKSRVRNFSEDDIWENWEEESSSNW